MNKPAKVIIPLVIFVSCWGIYRYLISGEEEAGRGRRPVDPVEVDGSRLRRGDYGVVIRSQGTVRPRTEGTLIPEVSGRIVAVSDNFRDGGFFEQGDVLVTIDPVDYKTAVVVAEASLAQARVLLAEEGARADQAARDWGKLGSGDAPSELVLRRPQLAQALAGVASEEARLEEARRDLERTRITAPYAGRVLAQNVDFGQYVTPGTVLARIYAVDYAEIRLPLSDRQIAHLDLPELYRGDTSYASHGPGVVIKVIFGAREFRWDGRIVRAEGAIDTQSRQLFVVAKVDDPYGRSQSERPPLKVGQFVEAEIEGRVLKDVFVIPRMALRENQYVLIIDKENKLDRRLVEVLWSDGDELVVRDNLTVGEILCVSAIQFAIQGMAVAPTIDGVPPIRKERGSGRGGPPGGGGVAGGRKASSASVADASKRPGEMPRRGGATTDTPESSGGTNTIPERRSPAGVVVPAD
jgi:RND family efflux transporter MFP subunit